ncbi:MAG: hypothetical protein AAB455_01270 [Patescibacteria group bacterium]
MTWDDLLERKSAFIGGDAEVHVGGNVIRGRIREITQTGRVVSLFVSWAAKFDPSCPTRWRKEAWPIEIAFGEFSTDHFDPELLENGGVTFVHKGGKRFADLLHPKGDDNLDPALVEGL